MLADVSALAERLIRMRQICSELLTSDLNDTNAHRALSLQLQNDADAVRAALLPETFTRPD